MTLQTETASGILFIADPHVADTPPGQRLPGYREQILDKMRACLEHAKENQLLPVFLGDLFNWPRDNSNTLLVALMDLFGPYRPWMVVGNHDKYQARLTDDCSISVLEAAGVVRLMKEPGPQFVLRTPAGAALVCASPDGARIPTRFDLAEAGVKDDTTKVLWLTHHNIAFPDFEEKINRVREIKGVDWLINGHIHRPQPTVRKGQTIWANPGNIARVTFSQRSRERVPAAHVWTWDCEELQRWDIPHLDFYEVFPRQDFPTIAEAEERESQFLAGLERLAWRRTQEGTGLKQFLDDNLDPEKPESRLIKELYQEVINEQE